MLSGLEHQNFQVLSCCEICSKSYDKHWKVVNHIRKNKDKEHKLFLSQQEKQALDIYLCSDRSLFHKKLFDVKNIFCGISFTNFCRILHKRFSSEEMEAIRINRISKTLADIPKTAQHNANVSKGVKEAWLDGKFDTPEIIEARRIGYLNRRSFVGSGNPMYGKPSPKGAGHGKGGIRQDIGHYVRSRWEANVARIANLVKRAYLYEPRRFSVTINGVEYTYCPDFYFPCKNLFYEIKGHARSSVDWKCTCKSCSKNKLIIPAIITQYKIKLILIGSQEYKRLERLFAKRIPLWEKSR